MLSVLHTVLHSDCCILITLQRAVLPTHSPDIKPHRPQEAEAAGGCHDGLLDLRVAEAHAAELLAAGVRLDVSKNLQQRVQRCI